jgi:hypothetical protein
MTFLLDVTSSNRRANAATAGGLSFAFWAGNRVGGLSKSVGGGAVDRRGGP